MSALVTAEQAAALLSVPKSWVLAEARADRIPHLRLGRYVRFEPDVLLVWWTERRRGPSVAWGAQLQSAPATAPTVPGLGPEEYAS